MQEKPNESKQKSLHFLGFLWPNWAFSMRYGESKQKILFPRHSRLRLYKAASTLLLSDIAFGGLRP